jgi:hypothetical protein
MADGQVIDKRFSREELASLLTAAAVHLVKRCREVYCDPIPPEQFVFLVVPSDEREASPPLQPYSTIDVIRFLLRDDGQFRDWINLSPVGTRSGSTVLELCYANRFTHRLLVGSLAMPFEPFQLHGPTLPPDWTEGTPIPRVALPELDL